VKLFELFVSDISGFPLFAISTTAFPVSPLQQHLASQDDE